MIVPFRRGNMAETCPVHGKLDHHVSAGRKRDGYKQLPVSVEFTKYGNTLFRPVLQLNPLYYVEFRDIYPLRRSAAFKITEFRPWNKVEIGRASCRERV